MKNRVAGCLAAIVAAVFSFAATAGEVSSSDAKAAVQAWLAKFGGMEGTRLGTLADKEPAAYTNAEGRTLFYVLDLAGGGSAASSPKFLEVDFKKKDGFLKSLRRSAELGLYRQAYCGCEFSRRNAGAQDQDPVPRGDA